MAADEKAASTLTRRRRKDVVADEDEDEKAERLAKAKALLKALSENEGGNGTRTLDDLEYLLLVSLLFGIVATVVAFAAGLAYFHLEGTWRPVVHAGDAPRYQACDRLSQARVTSGRSSASLIGCYILFHGTK